MVRKCISDETELVHTTFHSCDVAVVHLVVHNRHKNFDIGQQEMFIINSLFVFNKIFLILIHMHYIDS